jgi:hypothetical protein
MVTIRRSVPILPLRTSCAAWCMVRFDRNSLSVRKTRRVRVTGH